MLNFENYDIQVITKTINVVNQIEEGVVEYNSTHENIGIAGIRIFDVEKGYELVVSKEFENPIEDLYKTIETAIQEYKNSSPLSITGLYEIKAQNRYIMLKMYICLSEHILKPFNLEGQALPLHIYFNKEGYYDSYSIIHNQQPINLKLSEKELGTIFEYIYTKGLKEQVMKKVNENQTNQ